MPAPRFLRLSLWLLLLDSKSCDLCCSAPRATCFRHQAAADFQRVSSQFHDIYRACLCVEIRGFQCSLTASRSLLPSWDSTNLPVQGWRWPRRSSESSTCTFLSTAQTLCSAPALISTCTHQDDVSLLQVYPFHFWFALLLFGLTPASATFLLGTELILRSSVYFAKELSCLQKSQSIE